MAYELGLSTPERFQGVAALSTSLPEETAISTSTINEHHERLSIFIQHGVLDEIVTIDRGRNARDQLEKIGLKPKYYEYQMQHQISAESLTELSTWINGILI